MREILNLNTGWRFSPDFKQEYTRHDFKDSTFKLVDIPHVITEQPLAYMRENGASRISCYRKMFMLPEDMRGKRKILHFEGVMGCAAVFVNGNPVSAHKGGYSPFSCEVTDDISELLNAGDNLITVAVDTTEREDVAPFGDDSAPCFWGGIYREVRLEGVDDVFVTGVRVNTIKEKDGWLLDISGELSTIEKTEVRVYVENGTNRMLGKYILAEDGGFSYRIPVTAAVNEWSPSQPYLYTLLVTTQEGDEYRKRFGFRTAEFKPEGFFLNGVQTKLLGLERIQNFPRLGAALPAYQQRRDAELLSELGCNMVRTGATPPSSHFLDACDELGIMVLEELPACGSIGGEEWQECLISNMRELILRDRHHPSIVLWGTRAAEFAGDSELFRRTYKLTMELDGSRSTTGIRDVPCTEPIVEDVYSVGDYSNDGTNAGLEKKKNMHKLRLPYLVAAHTGMSFPAPAESGARRLTEQALRHAKAIDAAFGEAECCGVIGQTLADYNCRRHLGTEGDICSCGVTDGWRIKKPAAYLYQAQQDKNTMLYAAPTDASESVIYCFTNCDSVKLYRDDAQVGTFLPDKKNYPNMPHPPIVIDDVIGDLLVSAEGLEQKDAATAKNVLSAMKKAGLQGADARMRFASASRSRLPAARLCALYDKYLAGRFGGGKLRIDGIKSGEVFRSIVLEPVTETGIQINCDRTELMGGTTYDCTRIELIAVDQNGNRLYEANDAVSVECEGSIEIIGCTLFSLRAGACAFFVRNKGGRGTATVRIVTESLGTHTVDIEIQRERPDPKRW